MIPTFNCAKYLKKTLESVLSQDPGQEKMQIEVIDDCSTKDNPEEVTRHIGNGRVVFYKNEKNTGLCTKNFNICIKKSQGQLVHILHGDDLVLPGFYKKMANLADENPNASFYGCRTFNIDQEGIILNANERIKSLEKMTNNNEAFFYGTAVQAAGVVVRRSFYEQHGGFNENLIHTADCEMWARAIFFGGGVVTPEVLGCYRVFENNDTSTLMQTGENIVDYLKLSAIYKNQYKGFNMKAAHRRALHLSTNQLEYFKKKKLKDAVTANKKVLKKISPFSFRMLNQAKGCLKKIIRRYGK